MGLVVRPGTAADADCVAAIYVESWNAGFGDLMGVREVDTGLVARWRRDLGAGPQRWWVAERDARVVGFAGVGPSRDPVDARLGELDTIAVTPDEWRSGVGRALMTVARRALDAEFAEAIVWTVAGYERGHRFYEATGWTADGGTRAEGREVSFRRRRVRMPGVSGVGELLERIAEGLFQQAFVVADLDAAQRGMRATLGCSEFVNLPASDLDYELRGARVSCAIELGFARSGNMQIELLHPVRGKGLHVEFLASNGPGLHHLGFLVDDIGAVIALGESHGFPRVMGAKFGSLTFCYLDTWDALGLYVELVEDPDAMMMSLMPWR